MATPPAPRPAPPQGGIALPAARAILPGDARVRTLIGPNGDDQDKDLIVDMARFVRAPRVFATVEAAAALVELAMAGITTHAEYNAVLESIQNAALAPPAQQQQQQQHQPPTPLQIVRAFARLETLPGSTDLSNLMAYQCPLLPALQQALRLAATGDLDERQHFDILGRAVANLAGVLYTPGGGSSESGFRFAWGQSLRAALNQGDGSFTYDDSQILSSGLLAYYRASQLPLLPPQGRRRGSQPSGGTTASRRTGPSSRRATPTTQRLPPDVRQGEAN